MTKEYFEIVGEHADERATSVMMHLCPELVTETNNTNFEAKKFKIEDDGKLDAY
jgi:creatinine amidohydrolase/Fe(II)-dependent formamide hydrolase-like protein